MKNLEQEISNLQSVRCKRVRELQTLLEIQNEFDVLDPRFEELQSKINSLIFNLKFDSREIDYKRMELEHQKLFGDE